MRYSLYGGPCVVSRVCQAWQRCELYCLDLTAAAHAASTYFDAETLRISDLRSAEAGVAAWRRSQERRKLHSSWAS